MAIGVDATAVVELTHVVDGVRKYLCENWRRVASRVSMGVNRMIYEMERKSMKER